jgi:amino acid adenylation domain-containing protein
MVARLRALASLRPSDTALIAIARDGETRWDYATLDAQARALAAELQAGAAQGDRALILLDNDQHYVCAFFACLYAGLVAVPVFPPESAREQHLARLVGIASDAEPAFVLTSAGMLDLLKPGHALFGAARVIAVDAPRQRSAAEWHEHSPAPAPDDIAFLQYTSGSTSAPKGVMVSHANLMANERAIEETMRVTASDVFVSWLPLYHDMGLIGGLLQPIHCGIPVVLMSPAYFLERPVRWLEAISRHRATISGGPDFAYRMCLDRVKPSQLQGLDLSCWRLAFSGAEPVRHDTLQAFAEHVAPAGFSAASLYACYGLAESTLLVTGGKRGSHVAAQGFSPESLAAGHPQPSDDGTVLVGCGGAARGHVVDIVDPASGRAVAPGGIGEICVSGPSVAQGYWRQPSATAETFVEREGRRWLRTGDLGFWHEGDLFIAGRCKDLIILRGHNVYPQDIERVIEEEVEAVRKGRVAAFAVPAIDGREGVGIALEISRGMQKLVPADALVDALNLAVTQACGEAASAVLLLNPGALPKTSSGKLRRRSCWPGWQSRELDAYAVWEHGRFVLGDTARHAECALPLSALEQSMAQLWQAVLPAAGRPPGRDSHFFSLGGNSLSAVQLAARIGEQWRVDYPARWIFEQPRLHEATAALQRLLDSGARAAVEAIPARTAADDQGPWPLSPGQQRQWFLWQLDRESSAYHVGARLNLQGPLDTTRLQAALAQLVERHAALRTVFRLGDDGLPQQWAMSTAAPALVEIDLRPVPADQRDTEASAAARRFAEQPFDLTAGPLLRLACLRLADAAHMLVLVMHHIVSDAASVQVFFDELGQLMSGGSLGATPVHIADYTQWQRAQLAAGERDRQLAYWRQQLGVGETTSLHLPTDRPRSSATRFAAVQHRVALTVAQSAALRAASHAHGATTFMALATAFSAMLHRITGHEDIRLGVPVANRSRPEAHRLIGFLVNTQVLRAEVTGRTRLVELLGRVRQAALDAQVHADLPFDELVDVLQPQRSLATNPLFQVMFNHLHEEASALSRWPAVQARIEPLAERHTQFDLALDTVEQADGAIAATFTYAAELFDAETIAHWVAYFMAMCNALSELAESAETTVGDVTPAGGPDERLHHRNDLRFPADKPVHRLFEQRVAEVPDALALIHDDEQLTYAELNRRANRVAHHLIALGIGPESRVGVAIERSVSMIVGLLGVLKTGAAYVPLDPQYPAVRLAHMAEDSDLALLLTQSSLDVLPSVRRVLIDALPASLPEHNPDVAVHPANAAYVIYTSGSTGRPKGIAIAHHALAEHIQAAVGYLGLTPADRMLQFSTLNFDACIEQIYPPLIAGAAIVLRGPQLWDSRTFHRELIDKRISVADLTTAYWHLLVQDFARQGVREYGCLRQMHASGEAMPPEGLKTWHDAGMGHIKLLNLYGPTEATVTASAFDCAELDANALPSQLPIGRPVPGRHLHVLDAQLQPVPRGTPGELCIGGDLLARGYLNRPSLTAERFVADPFSETGGRLYRTGDLVRWTAEGQLRYLGRIDHQVKVRGFRIELGEIEAQLLHQSGVRQAVVVARPGPSGTRLLAYASLKALAELDGSELRAALAAELPDYMVPQAVVVLDELPLNPNGKIDRAALPEPASANVAFAPPLGEAEVRLAALWAEVLGVDRIGRHDHFFELGGHSIAAIQITALLAQRHGVELPVRGFFEQPLLKDLAAAMPAAAAQGNKQERLARMDQLLDEFLNDL